MGVPQAFPGSAEHGCVASEEVGNGGKYGTPAVQLSARKQGAPHSALYVRTYYRYPVMYRLPFKTRVRLLGALPRHRAHREHWTYRARPEHAQLFDLGPPHHVQS